MIDRLRLAALEARSLWGTLPLRAGWLALAALAALAIVQGDARMEAQRHAIAALEAGFAREVDYLARKYGDAADAGLVAYYLFVPTSDPPPALAGLANGMRDVLPATVPVRMLGLYGQLFDSDWHGAAQAPAGPYDLAFFLVFLLPAWLLVLLHGVLAEDREAGRAALLEAMGATPARLLAMRAAIRLAAVVAFAWAALTAGFAWCGAPWDARAAALFALVALYLFAWTGIGCAIVAAGGSSIATLLRLVATWSVFTLALPGMATLVLERTLPVTAGVDLTLKHRQAVHRAWDEPRADALERFFVEHPEWRGTPPVTGRFHWKWYYAMQHAGDMAVRADVGRYRAQVAAREAWTLGLGLALPPAGLHRAMASLAGSDIGEHFAYLEHVRAYHDRLRRHFYPFVFDERPFRIADYTGVPRFQPGTAPPEPGHAGLAAALLGWALAGVAVAARLLAREGRAPRG